ncbi:MAG: RHS repeat protein [Candidatus Aminicenantes bacterium]|nr:MAG: RHS repeat protein [Candidatus Aminicenantes bacterium]
MKTILLLILALMLTIVGSSEEKPNSQVNNPAIYSNVMLDTGELVWQETDLRIPGRGMDFVFQRTYRSQVIYSGVLGWGWDHNYNKRMKELYTGDIIYYDGSGRRERFKAEKNGNTIIGYKAPKGWFVELIRSEDGLFYLIYPDRRIECYNSVGLLTKILDRNFNKLVFFYDVSNQLTGVMDTMGRLIQLEYYPFEKETDENGVPEGQFKATSGRLKKITDFSNRTLTFEYYENGDLKYVDFEGRKKEYTYSQNDVIYLAHNLETIKDPKGQIALSVTYSGDKVTEVNIGGSKLKYITGESSATVTDGRNNLKKFTLQDGHIKTITEGGYTTSFTYNADGLIETVTYPELNIVTYGYQGGENRRSSGNLTSITETPGPRGDGDCPLNPTLFSYETYYNQVTSITYPNGLMVINSSPDNHGNFQSVSKVGSGINDVVYTYKFNKYGQIESETDSFGMTTVYKYFSEEIPGGWETTKGGRKLDKETGGYLKERSSGLLTENFKKYDQRGNLLEYSDSFGSSGLYTYTGFDELHTEERVAAFSLSPLTYKGVYGYDPNGNLISMSTAYGKEENNLSNSFSYTYTTRNMLWIETDLGRGITTTYTYDANDNLESISNGIDSLSFTYNNRDLVESVRQGSAPGVSIFTYDGNGNIITQIDPYGHATTNEYDGYDRLKTVIDPLNNKTVITRLNFGNTLNIKHIDAAESLLRESVRVNDPLGRLQQYTVKIPGGTDEVYNYSYQDNGKILVITDSLNRTWTAKKNDFGQVYYEEDPAGNYTNYYYEDGRGNMTKKVETEKGDDGTEKTYTTEYTYNAFNKVEEIKEWINGD